MSEIQSLANLELNKDKIFIIPKSLISKNKITKPQKKLFSRIKLFLILSIIILIPILIIIFLRKKFITRKNPEIITTYKEEEKNQNSETFYNNILKLINTEPKYQGTKKCYYNYKENEDKCIYKYLCPKKVIGKNLKLYGRKKDGGYVLHDDLNDIKIAYSFGVNEEFSFELNLADNNIESYMYDYTVDKLKYENYNFNNENFTHDLDYYQKKLHFFKFGLEGKKSDNDIMKTLEELIITNGHTNEKNMILKMDIEGAELDVFSNLSDELFQKFKYITLELHFKNKPKEIIYTVLKKLSNFHQLIYLRCNNWGSVVELDYNRLCECFEASYIIKEGNKFVKDDEPYPFKEFDYNNREGVTLDIDLNIFKLFYDK